MLEEEYGTAFDFKLVDFADSAALNHALAGASFDRIVHLGAQAGVRYGFERPEAYVQSNLIGHANLLELARARQPRHMVYASSSSVYGANTELPFRVEDRTDRPISLYAATKRSNELMSESYASLFRLPLTGLRFFTVYGPWGRPDMAMWLFTKAIIDGEPLDLFNRGAMRRDFTYIDDVVDGILACVDSAPKDDGELKPGGSVAPHALYNIGNNRSEELQRLVALLEECIGRKAVINPHPMQPGDVPNTFADIGPIRSAFGFEPRTNLDEGVPMFVEWYKRYHGID